MEIFHYLHQPSTWGNQRGELTNSVSSKFLAPLPGTQGDTSRRDSTIASLKSRCRTPVYKIGELHTIFYLCFLVLLVYLSVFTFVSLIKNTKNTCYLSCVVKYVRRWYYEGIRGLGFPPKERGEYEEGMGQNF